MDRFDILSGVTPPAALKEFTYGDSTSKESQVKSGFRLLSQRFEDLSISDGMQDNDATMINITDRNIGISSTRPSPQFIYGFDPAIRDSTGHYSAMEVIGNVDVLSGNVRSNDPATDSDLTTKRYVDSLQSHIEANVAAVMNRAFYMAVKYTLLVSGIVAATIGALWIATK